ncbi:MAG TPA: M48 family metalloprotease [Alphaproteobacteria bacterium]|nr:M48 family metalloprotease [Alphaproteobacteria bacterium]
MKCSNCGQPVQIADKFCALCGSKQEHNQSIEPPTASQNPQLSRLSQNLVQVTDFNPEIYRSQGESRIWDILQKNEDFMERAKKTIEEREEDSLQAKLELITNSYRVDPAITPIVHQIGLRLRWVLRLVQPMDVYIRSDARPNAFCVPTKKGNRLIMCLHSSLVELMTPQEILFVMGHEVGHALLKHSQMPPVEFGHPGFSPLEFMRLRSLSRHQEISCDRIGLIACQDINAAGSALFKLASGLSQRWIKFDENAYAKHFDDISGIADLTGLERGAVTHPITPLRVKALVSFSNSEIHAKLFGHDSWELNAVDLDRQVENMLSVLEPDVSELETEEEGKAANEFLINGALLVIASDGTVDPAEVSWLMSEWEGLDMEQIKSFLSQPNFLENTFEALEQPAYVLRNKLTELDRLGIFRTMLDAALCSEPFPQAEFETIDRLRALLDIRPEFAQKVHNIAVDEHRVPTDEEIEREIEEEYVPDKGDVVKYFDPRVDEVFEAKVTQIRKDGTIVMKAEDDDIVTLKPKSGKYLVSSKFDDEEALISFQDIWQ